MTSHTARLNATQIRPETELTRRPGAEPQPHRPGTFTTGPWAVGIVVGLVIGGHRGQQGATAILFQVHLKWAGKGLKASVQLKSQVCSHTDRIMPVIPLEVLNTSNSTALRAGPETATTS